MATQSDTELMRVIGRIEGKIDGMLTSMMGLHAEHKELKADYEGLRTKVNNLENRLYLYAGGITVISPVAFIITKSFLERLT